MEVIDEHAAEPHYLDPPIGGGSAMVTADDIRAVALSLPRTEEALVRDQVKFRVGRIVYVALSRDELSMGFGFPKDERAALVAAQPEKFFMPIQSDLRYNWVRTWLKSIDQAEMRELVVDAWSMVVPKRVAAAYLRDHPSATTQQQLPSASARKTKSPPSG